MAERWFVDTSAWFAYTNRRDTDHGRVRALLRQKSRRLVTSSGVFDETVTLCRMRLGHRAAVQVGTALRETADIDVVHVSPDVERAAWDLFTARAGQAYSFTDCTSFVLMRRLSLETAVALDDDFRTEGFRVLPAE